MTGGVEVPGGLPGMPRRIGIVVEDVDGRVWAFETSDLEDVRLTIDHPQTRAVPMDLPTQDFAQALAKAMRVKRVTLSFATRDPWKWKVR